MSDPRDKAALAMHIIANGCTCSPHCKVKQDLARAALDDLDDLEIWLQVIELLAANV